MEEEKDVIEIEDTGETLEDLRKEFEAEEKKEVEEKMEELIEDKNEALKKELEEYKDKYLRAIAEIENTKKRFLKEREENRLYGLYGFFKEFLPVLDNLKRATNEEINIEAVKEGLKLIIRQIENLLSKYGVKEENSKEGDPFDPYFQEAISTEKSKGVDKPTILNVLQRGYFLHDRLLRPTLVHIALPEEEEEDAQDTGN